MSKLNNLVEAEQGPGYEVLATRCNLGHRTHQNEDQSCRVVSLPMQIEAHLISHTLQYLHATSIAVKIELWCYTPTSKYSTSSEVVQRLS